MGTSRLKLSERQASETRTLRRAGRKRRQLKHDTVVDCTAFDDASFKADGGFTRLNKLFGGTLEAQLGELTDEVWKDAGLRR